MCVPLPTASPNTVPLPALQGKRLFFVTNNSTKSRAGYLNKFTSLGLKVKAVSAVPSQTHSTAVRGRMPPPQEYASAAGAGRRRVRQWLAQAELQPDGVSPSRTAVYTDSAHQFLRGAADPLPRTQTLQCTQTQRAGPVSLNGRRAARQRIASTRVWHSSVPVGKAPGGVHTGSTVSHVLPVSQEEVYSSSYAAAAYLESIKFSKKVYVIGEVGIQEVSHSTQQVT